MVDNNPDMNPIVIYTAPIIGKGTVIIIIILIWVDQIYSIQ